MCGASLPQSSMWSVENSMTVLERALDLRREPIAPLAAHSTIQPSASLD